MMLSSCYHGGSANKTSDEERLLFRYILLICSDSELTNKKLLYDKGFPAPGGEPISRSSS